MTKIFQTKKLISQIHIHLGANTNGDFNTYL
jgi:hypothetical protein